MIEARGCIVDAWAQRGGDRIFASGRLSDGRSFAFMLRGRGSEIFVTEAQAEMARVATASDNLVEDESVWTTMPGLQCRRFFIPNAQYRHVIPKLGRAGVKFVPAPVRPAWDYLCDLGIGLRIVIEGEGRAGRAVDAVFSDPAIRPDESAAAIPLRWAAIDIETDRESRVVAVSIACDTARQGIVREVLFLGPATGAEGVTSFDSERDLLVAFSRRLREIDPDVITGWNVIDFDFRVLCERFEATELPFLAARTDEPVGLSGGNSTAGRRGSGRFVGIQGRVVIDAMRLVRGLGRQFADYTLDTVARELLGEGKSVAERGEDKIERLEALRISDPAAFCAYCLTDSGLVLSILDTTGLVELTMKRALLTGVSLDIAWTSIPVFERVYGARLRQRHIVPVPRDDIDVSGAAGGTILEPRAGIFGTVLVFDFRSLYPSIMRTFNIDPLSRARAAARADTGFPSDSDIVAPNGARFDRREGIMPSLIRSYAREREAALANGDEYAAFVLKILQNSFYGVLGSNQCAYARTDLAGAITSFARKFLHASRDWFESSGRRVLYGDTDSVFVEANPGDGEDFAGLCTLGENLAAGLDAHLKALIGREYGLESELKIRCEKVYGRFLIPRLRMEWKNREAEDGDDAGEDQPSSGERGRSKGYAGLVLSGQGSRVEIKGMEAVRSDWTPLARRFQTELIGLVFSGEGRSGAEVYCRGIVAGVRKGEFDGELVYRKRLRRQASAYASASPQVKAARLLGWTDRRGAVSYLMTKAGPQPLGLVASGIDYAHYIEKQLLPIASSVGAACGWQVESWFRSGDQLDFGFLSTPDDPSV